MKMLKTYYWNGGSNKSMLHHTILINFFVCGCGLFLLWFPFIIIYHSLAIRNMNIHESKCATMYDFNRHLKIQYDRNSSAIKPMTVKSLTTAGLLACLLTNYRCVANGPNKRTTEREGVEGRSFQVIIDVYIYIYDIL